MAAQNKAVGAFDETVSALEVGISIRDTRRTPWARRISLINLHDLPACSGRSASQPDLFGSAASLFDLWWRVSSGRRFHSPPFRTDQWDSQ
ncbi:MAG: hypothetical protein K8E66_02135 [Phycisphaerales bacterium]|nr:hypothetical protein [Phycisphaerales bacterium]